MESIKIWVCVEIGGEGDRAWYMGTVFRKFSHAAFGGMGLESLGHLSVNRLYSRARFSDDIRAKQIIFFIIYNLLIADKRI
jgi:hypothetical protein